MAKIINMCKIVTIFFLSLGLPPLFTPLYAEITVGILKTIDSNSKVRLSHKNSPVFCQMVGIRTLDDLPTDAPDPQQCREQIESYYQAHPHERNFAKEVLHKEQSYHYELFQEGCALYANGPESFSEMLLRRGLALLRSDFSHKEWNGKFQRALKGAEEAQLGLHATQIKKFCMKEEK